MISSRRRFLLRAVGVVVVVAPAAVLPPSLGGGVTHAWAAPGSAPAPLRIAIDKTKVDMKAHHLELRLSRPAGKVQIKVTSDADAVLADEEQDFSGRPAGATLVVTWNPSSDAQVARIEVRAFDARGAREGRPARGTPGADRRAEDA